LSIYLKLNNARADFHSKSLRKSGKNKFAGYDYFELGDFVLPAMDSLSKSGLCAFVSFNSEVATMTLREVEGEGVIEITSPFGSAQLKGAHEIQNIGAVETYQRRYLWMALMEIVEHDAIDSSEGSSDDKKKVELLPSIKAMHQAIQTEDCMLMRETWDELNEDERKLVWMEFKTKDKTIMKGLLHESTKGEKNE